MLFRIIFVRLFLLTCSSLCYYSCQFLCWHYVHDCFQQVLMTFIQNYMCWVYIQHLNVGLKIFFSTYVSRALLVDRTLRFFHYFMEFQNIIILVIGDVIIMLVIGDVRHSLYSLVASSFRVWASWHKFSKPHDTHYLQPMQTSYFRFSTICDYYRYDWSKNSWPFSFEIVNILSPPMLVGGCDIMRLPMKKM